MGNDDVEFADVGVFTQAMNVAMQEVLSEDPSSSKRRRTRRQARINEGRSSKVNLTDKRTTLKTRRRIVVHDSSDDED